MSLAARASRSAHAERPGRPREPGSGPGERGDLERHRAILGHADDEGLLAALGMPGTSAVRKPPVVGLIHDLDDPARCGLPDRLAAPFPGEQVRHTAPVTRMARA